LTNSVVLYCYHILNNFVASVFGFESCIIAGSCITAWETATWRYSSSYKGQTETGVKL